MSLDRDAASCPHCGERRRIFRGIDVNQLAEVGTIGLEFKDGRILVGTEQLVADLCGNCGTVVRLYVRNVNHKWLTKPPGGGR